MELTRKQKAFANELLKDKKISGTSAVIKAGYNVKSRHVARQIARENLQKPAISNYLEKYADTALEDNIEIARYSKEYGQKRSGEKGQGSKYAAVAAGINKDIIDRVLGKPKQSVELSSTVVTLGLSLADVTTDTPDVA